MPLPKPLRRFKRRTLRRVAWAVCAVLLIGFLWQNGLHNIGTLSAQNNSDCVSQPVRTEPAIPELPDVTAKDLQDPKTITGPTTAYTKSAAIAPITDVAGEVQRLPATITSSDGIETTVTDTTRILALNQNGGLAAAVIALGFGCNLIGRDIATQYTSLMPGNEELPLVTQNGHELNAEAILQLSPTVVLSDTSIGPYDVQLQLRDAGIPVVMVPLAYEDGVHGVADQIKFVADALGVSELGKQLAERTQAEIGATIQALGRFAPANEADKPRTVFLYLRGSIYYWFGAGSGADSLIQAVGGRDVATEVGFEGMAPTNSEALIKAAPDVIIVMTKGLASVGGIEKAVELPGIKQTPAGQNMRFVDMSDYEVMSFGPRTANVLAALGTAIYAPEYAYVPEDAEEEQQ